MVKSQCVMFSIHFFYLRHDTEILHVNSIIHEVAIKLCYSWCTNEEVCNFRISKFGQSILMGKIEVNFHFFFTILLNDDMH